MMPFIVFVFYLMNKEYFDLIDELFNTDLPSITSNVILNQKHSCAANVVINLVEKLASLQKKFYGNVGHLIQF